MPRSTDTNVAVICGPLGSGKTTDLSRFPNAILVGKKRGFRPCRLQLGIDLEPSVVEVYYIEEVTSFLYDLQVNGAPSWARRVIVDDLTELAMASFRAVERLYPREGDGVLRMWGDNQIRVMNCVDAALNCGLDVVFTTHLRQQKESKDPKGGPRLPSKENTEAFCRDLTHVIMCQKDASLPTDWKGGYKTDPHNPTLVSKDRHSVIGKAGQPMNLAECWRFAGVDVGRFDGYEWHEAWVESVACEYEDGKKPAAILEWLEQDLDIPPLERRWIMKDGLDRAVIRARYAAACRVV